MKIFTLSLLLTYLHKSSAVTGEISYSESEGMTGLSGSGQKCRCGEELTDDDSDYIVGGNQVKIVSFIKHPYLGQRLK